MQVATASLRGGAARRGVRAFGAVALALLVSCRSGAELPMAERDRAGCEVSAAGPGGPVTDPSGPYYHQVAVATTTDGVTLSAPWLVLDHASVPDAAVGPDGFPLIYYVNGADGPVWIARLLDDTANVIGPLMLDGIARPAGVVDPDATRLSDGRIRLVYLSGFGPPGISVQRAFCVAESPDGVRFTVVQRALWVPANFTDPSVTQLPDGSWLMGISLGGQTVLARSSDGYGFAVYDTLNVGGVPEVHALADGRVRLYVCRNGIESHLSADRGVTWTREATVVPSGVLSKRIVCDPSLVAGTNLFVFKTAD